MQVWLGLAGSSRHQERIALGESKPCHGEKEVRGQETSHGRGEEGVGEGVRCHESCANQHVFVTTKQLANTKPEINNILTFSNGVVCNPKRQPYNA